MGALPSRIRNIVRQTTNTIQRIPRQQRIYILVIAGSAIAVPLIVCVVGFTPAGVAAGSLAAIWHASIGNVAAGSVFAILQSLGTAPLLLAGIGALTGAAGCFLHFLWNLWRSPRWYQNIWGDDQDDDYGSGRDSEKTSKRLEC